MSCSHFRKARHGSVRSTLTKLRDSAGQDVGRLRAATGPRAGRRGAASQARHESRTAREKCAKLFSGRQGLSVCYPGIKVDDALEIAEKTEVYVRMGNSPVQWAANRRRFWMTVCTRPVGSGTTLDTKYGVHCAARLENT
jgi:hypothetical protein